MVALCGGSQTKASPSAEFSASQQVPPSPTDTVADAPNLAGKKAEKQKSVEKWGENLPAKEKFDDIDIESIISQDTVPPPAYSESPHVQDKLMMVRVMLEKVKVPNADQEVLQEEDAVADQDEVRQGWYRSTRELPVRQS